MPSTVATLLNTQKLIDYARTFDWTHPTMGVAGYAAQPAQTFADDIVKKIMAKTNPWKWNAAPFPVIETQPFQQDYPTSVSQNTLGWFQSAIIVDINNTQQPQPIFPVNAVNNILPTFLPGRPQKACWIANAIAQTAVWGRGRPGDPGPGITYTDPLIWPGHNGGPSNNALTAITDANGNILVLTTHGTTGTVAPLASANAPDGTTVTDGSVVWTVKDPNGAAVRIDFLATFNSPVWELRSLYQKKPPNITTIQQTLAPIPEDLDYLIKQGFLAYCYKKSDSAKFATEYAQWLEDIQAAMEASDREYQEFGFYPAMPLQGGGGEPGTGTYGYPGWPGWS